MYVVYNIMTGWDNAWCIMGGLFEKQMKTGSNVVSLLLFVSEEELSNLSARKIVRVLFGAVILINYLSQSCP